MGFFDNLLSGASTYNTNKTNLEIASMTNEANMQLAEYEYEQSNLLADKQNAYDLDMWNKTNEYNDPSAQMERFAAAGLNPNLVYGSGTSTTAEGVVGSSTGSYNAPSMQSATMQSTKYSPMDLMSIAGFSTELGQKQQNLENDRIQGEILGQLLQRSKMDTANHAQLLNITNASKDIENRIRSGYYKDIQSQYGSNDRYSIYDKRNQRERDGVDSNLFKMGGNVLSDSLKRLDNTLGDKLREQWKKVGL